LRWSNALCPAAASKSQQQPLGHPDKSLLSIHQTPHVESEFFTSEKTRYYIADVRKLRSKGSVSPWSMNEMYALGNLRKMTVSTQIISNSHRDESLVNSGYPVPCLWAFFAQRQAWNPKQEQHLGHKFAAEINY